MKIFSILVFLLFSATTLATDVNIVEAGLDQLVDDHKDQKRWIVVKIWKHDCGVCLSSLKDVSDSSVTFSEEFDIIGLAANGVDDSKVKPEERMKLSFDTLSNTGSDFLNYVSDLDSINTYLENWKNANIFGYPAYLIFSPNGDLKALQTGLVNMDEIRNYIRRKSKR